MNTYETKKQELVQTFQQAHGNITLAKDTSNLFRHRRHSQSARVDVRHFMDVVSVDRQQQLAEVEGMTPYWKLVDATLAQGLMPPVVPELKSITIGGAVTGLGIESSSFKYGLVHESIRDMEIILGDGSIVYATADNEHRDLFFGFPNSFGTLGYVLKLTVPLVPVKKYVALTHIRFADTRTFFAEMEKFCDERAYDFIDGTIFGRSEMYLTLGKFTDAPPYASDYTYRAIYYKSIRRRQQDYLTIKDYIWRWDTDWFWCSRHLFAQNPLVRLLLGRRFLNSITYGKIMRLNHRWQLSNLCGLSRKRQPESVIQDIEVTVDKAADFLEFFLREIAILPIWVCPTSMHNNEATYPLYIMIPNQLYVNFGFWGMVPTTHEDGHYNRMIERKVRELNGKKSLYSSSYYSEEEFWQIYNRPAYEKLKQQYDPQRRFPDLFQKCVLAV